MNVIAFDKICVAFLLRANVIFIHFSGLNVILQWKYEVSSHKYSCGIITTGEVHHTVML